METFAKLYYGYMDALISSMQTSIASESALAHTRPSMDFNSLNQESELLEFGNCLHEMVMTRFMDTT